MFSGISWDANYSNIQSFKYSNLSFGCLFFLVITIKILSQQEKPRSKSQYTTNGKDAL